MVCLRKECPKSCPCDLLHPYEVSTSPMTPMSPQVVDSHKECRKSARTHPGAKTPLSRIGLRPCSRHPFGEAQISVPDNAHGNLAENCSRRPLSSDTSACAKVAILRGECPETGCGRLGDRPCWVRRARAPFRVTPRAKPPLVHVRNSCKRSFHTSSQIYISGHALRGLTTFGPLTGAPGDSRYGAARVGNRPLWSVFRLPTWPKVVVSCAESIQS